jgi:hypothetical protein
MKTRPLLLTILLAITLSFLFLTCQKERSPRFEYMGYSLGERIDTNWVVVFEDELDKTKYLRHNIDTNFTCRTIADTIFDLTRTELSDEEASKLRNEINWQLDMSNDSMYENTIGLWDCKEYLWKDNRNSDEIVLSKCKIKKLKDYSNWYFEIINKELIDELNSRHDPYYNLKPPPMVMNYIK